jgi:trimeric autotransporter adhesin
MTMGFRGSFAVVVAAGAFACSSSGNNATNSSATDGGATGSATNSSATDGGTGSSSTAGSGMEIFSCALGDICNQIAGTASSAAAEHNNCVNLVGGTEGSGCPMAGVVGYCDMGVGGTQYVYSVQEAQVVQGTCSSVDGTWFSVDGGAGAVDGGAGAVDGGASTTDAGDAAAFVGSWMRSGSQTITCEAGSPKTSTFAGTLTLVLGSSPDTLVGTQPDGCATIYSVSGSVATAMADQTCDLSTDAGMETQTVTMHTLTLSADGTSLMSASTTTIDETPTMTTCTAVASGTYTKE